MNRLHPAKRTVLWLCLVMAPLLQGIGDSLWITQAYNFSWNLWREASAVFFLPVGFLLAKLIEGRSMLWAIIACAFFVAGSVGFAALMPLFRLGAFYPVHGPYEFPSVVQSVLGENGFAVTLFIPSLFFPISLLLFGIAFLKYKLVPHIAGIAITASGVLFWLGNAMEMEAVLIFSDAWLLAAFCYLGYVLFNKRRPLSDARLSSGRFEEKPSNYTTATAGK